VGGVARALAFVLLFLAVVLGAILWSVSDLERWVNLVEPLDEIRVSDEARRLHDEAFVVDLHADTTLFGRDLLVRSSRGHVDLPRLQEGGVGLQFFTVPTKIPLGFNIDATDGSMPDVLVLTDFLAGKGLGLGPFDRALIQAGRLGAAVQASGGELVWVRSRADVEALLEARRHDPRRVGALLGIEGAHALEGDASRVEELYDAGFRMIGLTHFFDNAFAGSAHGLERSGLTGQGRALLERMAKLGMMIDLSHLSPKAIDEVLAWSKQPVVVSHTGVKGTCDNVRNLSDRHVRAIAAGGGVIGIGYWDTAVCGIQPRDIAAAMKYVVDLVGDDHVALGSDYDGGTTVSFDTSQLRVLTQAMLDAGLAPESVTKILGGNILRVMREVLPER